MYYLLVISFYIDATDISNIYAWSSIDKVLKISSFIVLLCIYFFTKKNVEKWIVTAFAILLSVMTYYFSGNQNFLLFILFFVNSSEIDFDKFLKYDLYIRALSLILVFLLFITGFSSDTVLYRDSIIRHSWGFYHPNTLGTLVFVIAAEFLYLKFREIKLWDGIILSILIVFIYVVPNSRTAVYSLLFMVIFIFINSKKSWFENRIVKMLAIASPFLFTFISYSIVKFVDVGSQYYSTLNKFMSGRVRLYKNLWDLYSPTLFGQRIIELENEFSKNYGSLQMYLDNAYLSLLLRYGLAMTFFFLLFFARIIKNAIKENKYEIAILVLTFLVYGLAENIYFRIEYSPLCLLGAYFWRKKCVESNYSDNTNKDWQNV